MGCKLYPALSTRDSKASSWHPRVFILLTFVVRSFLSSHRLLKRLFTRREGSPSTRVTLARGLKKAPVYKQNLTGSDTLSLGSSILESARENCSKL